MSLRVALMCVLRFALMHIQKKHVTCVRGVCVWVINQMIVNLRIETRDVQDAYIL